MALEPAVRNAADPKQVRKASKTEAQQRAEEIGDLRQLLRLAEGRRVLWRLLSHCGVFESTYAIPDSQTFYKAGQQDVGHFIQAEIIRANPDAYVQMMTEYASAQE